MPFIGFVELVFFVRITYAVKLFVYCHMDIEM